MANSKVDIIELRTLIKANPILELELKGRISEVLRSHGVPVSPEVLSDLVFALSLEVGTSSFGPLPEPSLPPVGASDGQPNRGPSLPEPTLPPVGGAGSDGDVKSPSLPEPTLPPVGAEEIKGPLPEPSLPPV